MSDDQKHQVNELLKEQMRLTETLAIQKNKSRLAANSVLWEVPGLILFVVSLAVGFYMITTMGARTALFKTNYILNHMPGAKRGTPAYGPFDAAQIGVALFYPPLYELLNALTIYEARLTPTGAHFLVQGLNFISVQSTTGDKLNGASITHTAYAGTLESIAQSEMIDVVNVLYQCWYDSGLAGGYSTSDDARKKCWDYWMGTQYRWLAPNMGCFLTNPLVSCDGIFNRTYDASDENFKNDVVQDAYEYVLNSSVWTNVLNYGMCGYAVNHQDSTPETMFADVFGGAQEFNGQPFPCGGIGLQNAMSYSMMGAGGGGALAFTMLRPGTGLTGLASFLLATGATAAGGYGGYLLSKNITNGLGCKPASVGDLFDD